MLQPAARERTLGAIAWLAGSVALAVLLARIATIVQAHWSPLLVFPLLCGASLGLAVLPVLRWMPQPGRSWVLFVAALAGLVLSAAEHGFVYLDYRLSYERTREKHPQVQLIEQVFADVRPKTFAEFLAESAAGGRAIGSRQVQGWQVWSLWGLEAVVTAIAATAVVYWLFKPAGPNPDAQGSGETPAQV